MVELLLFDVGGVLIDLHSDQAHLGLSTALGISEDLYLPLCRTSFAEEPWSATELATLGLIETDQYLSAFASLAAGKVNQEVIRAHVASILGEERPEMSVLLSQLHGRVRLAAFTNTIDLHWQILRHSGRYPIFDFFEQLLASHLIHQAKPQVGAYQAAVATLGLQPSDVLFIDDLPVNIVGAEHAGLTGILYRNTEQLRGELAELGLLP